jgi:hypothetical protein
MRRLLLVRAAIAVTLLVPCVASAQDVTAPALKAAFIYNFVKFTEWPAPLPLSDPFVICVTGDDAVAKALERLVKGRQFADRPILVAQADGSRSKGPCHVLYVSGATATDAVRMVAGLRDSPVLTISDIVGFTDTGGIAQFFVEDGRLRFIIKVEAVERSGLKMSSRLLTLAHR